MSDQLDRNLDTFLEGAYDLIDTLFGVTKGAPDEVLNSPMNQGLMDPERAAMAFMSRDLGISHGELFALRSNWKSVMDDQRFMQIFPATAAVHEYFIDDSTQVDIQRNKVLWGDSNDEGITSLLNHFLKRIGYDRDIQEPITHLVEFGNAFGEVIYRQNSGVLGLTLVQHETMRRVEDPTGKNVGFIQDSTQFVTDQMMHLWDIVNGQGHLSQSQLKHLVAFPPWQMIHWRRMNHGFGGAYGRGLCYRANYLVKRLAQLNDMEYAHVAEKGVQRYKYDVEVEGPRSSWKSKLHEFALEHRNQIFANTSGVRKKRPAPSAMEDWIFPKKDGNPVVDISILDYPQVNYRDLREDLQRQLSLVLPAPLEALLTPQTRSVLSQDYPRAAKQSIAAQVAFKRGIEQAFRIHLALLGYQNAKNVEFDLHMVSPSGIYELTFLELQNARADLASRMQEQFPIPYIMKYVWGLSDEEANKLHSAKQDEAKARMKMERSQYESFDPDIAGSDMRLFGEEGFVSEPTVDLVDQPIYRTKERHRGDIPARSRRMKRLVQKQRQWESERKSFDCKSDEILEKLERLERTDEVIKESLKKLREVDLRSLVSNRRGSIQTAPVSGFRKIRQLESEYQRAQKKRERGDYQARSKVRAFGEGR